MNNPLRASFAAAVVAALCLLPLQAQAIFGDDEARHAILEIRSRLDAMQREINAKADRTTNLEFNNQNEKLRQEIAELRGQIEELTNELANAQRRQKDFYVDLDNRLRKLEPQQVTVDGKEASVGQTEQHDYDAALAHFRAGDYSKAGAAFQEFIRRYPQSAFSPSAQYWLGNTYYAQKDCKNAITTQQAVVKNHADSPKAPDALLNIASCQFELKDRAAARKTLESLVAQYPDAPSAQIAKQRLATLK